MLRADVDLTPWDVPPPGEVRQPDGGTNNSVWLIDDAVVLRVYDNVEAEHAIAEHRLLAALAERAELPFAIPVPIPARDGQTIAHTSDGRPAALFPFIPGYTARREDLDSIELAAEALGVLDAVLAELPTALAPRDGRGHLSRLHPAVDDLNELSAELDRQVPGHEGVAWFRDHLDSVEEMYAELAEDRTLQIIHGDYSLTNVLIHDGQVTGVLDFDHTYIGLRAEDPVAAMLMAAGFGTAGDDKRVAAFRRGYARTGASDENEVDVATLFRRRGLGGIVWLSGRWRRGQCSFEPVLEKLVEAVEIERWLATTPSLSLSPP